MIRVIVPHLTQNQNNKEGNIFILHTINYNMYSQSVMCNWLSWIFVKHFLYSLRILCRLVDRKKNKITNSK